MISSSFDRKAYRRQQYAANKVEEDARSKQWLKDHPEYRVRQLECKRLLRLATKLEAGGKCNRCGYRKCHAALDFHHRDPETKIKVTPYTYKWSEHVLETCDLLCRNCHAEAHYG